MIFPIPNVLHCSLSTALKRLNEYEVQAIEVETDEYPPDTVISYYPSSGKLFVKVAKAPKDSFSLDKNIAYVHRLGYVTGRESVNKEVLERGSANMTDLGIVVSTPSKFLYLYGDTFSGRDVNDGYWNSNFIAYNEKPLNLKDGLRFSGVVCDEHGMIKPIAQGLHHRNKEENFKDYTKEVTKIPTGGIYLNGYVYIFMMHVRYWGKPGEWFVTSNVCYKAKEDELNNFHRVEGLEFKESFSPRFGQIYPFIDGEYVYFLAIPGGRLGYISLLRVKKNGFKNLDEYELLVDKDTFMNLKEGLKLPPYYLVKEQAGEPSIMFNKYLNKWVISTLTRDGLKFYLSPSLSEEFKESMLVLNGKEVPSCYGGFVHSEFTKWNGQKMYLQISQWSPIYNTSLYEVVFNRKDEKYE